MLGLKTIVRMVVLLNMLMSNIIEAKINMKKTDKSTLEIDQRVYTNPYTIVNNLPSDSNEKTDNTQTKDFEKAQNVKNSKKTSRSYDPETLSLPSDTFEEGRQFVTIVDSEQKLSDAVTVGSKNIPRMPQRLIGPKRKPRAEPVFRGVGPKGIDDAEKPSCDEFSKRAHFNPYSVINEKWFNFYRWDINHVPLVVEFVVPTSLELAYIRSNMDRLERPTDWSSRILIMNDLIYNNSGLLIERSNNGVFWMYPILKNPSNYSLLEGIDIRFTQTADNKFIAFALCEDDRAYIFSRMNEIPRQKDIPDAVATIGWRGKDGRSYLYQGHKWMPIDEMSEEEYWTPRKYQKEERLPPAPDEYEPADEKIRIFN